MPNVNTGAVDPADRVDQERVAGASDYLTLIDADASPFYSILSNLPSPNAKSTQVTWTSEQHRPSLAIMAASASSAATQMDVGTGSGVYFIAGEQWVMGHTGEVVQVTGVTSDTVGITRSIGDIAASSAQTGTSLMLLPKPVAQGADIATYVWVQAASGYNYTQVFRTPLAFSGTMAEIKRYGSKGRAKDIADRLAHHLAKIERSLLFGPRTYDTSGTHPVGSMGGVYELCNGQVTSAGAATGGPLTLAMFREATQLAFATGTKKKAIFTGWTAAAGLQNVFGVNYRPNSSDRKRWGVRPDAFLMTPGGEVPVFLEPNLSASVGGTDGTPPVDGTLFLVDVGTTRLRPLRPTVLLENRQGPGKDEVTCEWLSELSLEISVPESNAIINRING